MRLAMAAMGQKETKVTDLCSELAITRQTLYRHDRPNRIRSGVRQGGDRRLNRGETRIESEGCE